jgi:TolB-like protein
MGSDEDKAFKVLRKNREIQRPIIKRYRGEWLKEMGDGILASFTTASDAVRCAGEIQEAVKKEGIGLRIGIHEGEVVFEAGDVLGDGVNVASRLEEMADAGAINISGAVYKDIKNKSGIETRFIEEKSLKNVDEPVKVYQVKFKAPEPDEYSNNNPVKKIDRRAYYVVVGFLLVIIFILVWQFLPRNETVVEETNTVNRSIAVLPFHNDSPDPDNEYLCNGIMEEILTQLQQIDELSVKSRTAVEKYRDQKIDVNAVASELDIAYFLEGSVRRIGDNLRITTQLIDVSSGDHLWAETYDGKYSEEIFNFQSEVAQKVASSLQAVITPKELERIKEKPANNIESHDLSMKGWYYIKMYQQSADKKYLDIAEDLFTSATELDTSLFRGYSGIAYIHFENREVDKLLQYAGKMIRTHPEKAEGYYKRSYYYWLTIKPAKAIEDFQKAIDLNPNHAYIPLNLGQLYCQHKKDLRSGIKYINQAFEVIKENSGKMDVDPFMYLLSGYAFVTFGDYERAGRELKTALEWNVGCRGISAYTYLQLVQGKIEEAYVFLDSICHVAQCDVICYQSRFLVSVFDGNFEGATEHYNMWKEDSGNLGDNYITNVNLYWAYVLKKMDNLEGAYAVANKVKAIEENRLGKNFGSSYYYLAGVYSILDQKDTAIYYLRELENKNWEFLSNDDILIDPIFEYLKDDQEFIALTDRVKNRRIEINKQIIQLEQEGLL